MRNALARYNLNDFNVIGPRQGLIIMTLFKGERLTATEVARKFRRPKGAASMLDAMRRLVRKGLVVENRETARITSDGAFYGVTFSLSAEGRRLARRMAKVTGLGNNFAIVRGRR